jgi:hypothetical protein
MEDYTPDQVMLRLSADMMDLAQSFIDSGKKYSDDYLMDQGISLLVKARDIVADISKYQKAAREEATRNAHE